MLQTRGRPASGEAGCGQRGAVRTALLGALLALTCAAALGSYWAGRVQASALGYRGASQAFWAADGGVEHGLDRLLALGRARDGLPTADEVAAIGPPRMAHALFESFRVAPAGDARAGRLTTGYFEGLIATSRPYELRVTALPVAPPTRRVSVAMVAELDVVPIFQFAVFAADDLDLFPGAEMTIEGPVHANGDLRVGATERLAVDGALSTAGALSGFRRGDGAPLPGEALIRAPEGEYRSVVGVDSTRAEWREQALQRWGGNLRTAVHGVERLDLTGESPRRPRRIIEPGTADDDPAARAAKLWYAAGLRIVEGDAVDAEGNPVSLRDPLTGAAAVRSTTLFDPRLGRHRAVLEVDVARLGRLPELAGGGIVHVRHSAADGAVALVRGERLPGPLTVVSSHHLYVRGDYNVEDTKPAALVADGVTVLSGAWSEDPAYGRRSLSRRPGRDTELRAALLLGSPAPLAAPASGEQGGPLGLLEDWSDRTLTVRGSIVALWRAVGASPEAHHRPPRRRWSFDETLLTPGGMPPGTPNAYAVRIVRWTRG